MSITLAIISGIFASLASLFSKIGVTSMNPLFGALMVASNILMWITFTKALSSSPSSITVQVLNASANTITTGLSGLLVLGEAVSPKWWIGAAFMLCGTLILSRKEGQTKEKAD